MMQPDNSTNQAPPPSVSSLLAAKLPPPPAALAAGGLPGQTASASPILSQALAKPPSLSSLKLNVPPPQTFNNLGGAAAQTTSHSAAATPLSMFPAPIQSQHSHSSAPSPLPPSLLNTSLNQTSQFLKQTSMPAPSPTPLSSYAPPKLPGSQNASAGSSLSNSFNNLNGPAPLASNSLNSSQSSALNASFNAAPSLGDASTAPSANTASSLFNPAPAPSNSIMNNLLPSSTAASTSQLFPNAPIQPQPLTSSLFPQPSATLNNGAPQIIPPQSGPISQPQQTPNLYSQQSAPPPQVSQFQTPASNIAPLQQQIMQPPIPSQAVYDPMGAANRPQFHPQAPFTALPTTATAPPNMFAPPSAGNVPAYGTVPPATGPPPQMFNRGVQAQTMNSGPPTGPPFNQNNNLSNGRLPTPLGPPQAMGPPSGPPMMSGPPPTGPPPNNLPNAFNPSSIPPPPTSAELANRMQQQPQQGPPPQQTMGYSGAQLGQYQAPPPSGVYPPPSGPPLQQQQNQMMNQFNKMDIGSPAPPPPPTQSQVNSQQFNNNNNNNAGYTNNNNSNNYSNQQYQQQYKSSAYGGAVDLFREKRLIMPYSSESDSEDEHIRPKFPHEFYTNVNCSSDIIRCTLTAIPETQALLNKIRLPLGILIHPFKDLESLKVVQSSTIVRCRNCRSYINPFVSIIDNSKWRCNLCYSMNELPDEFLFDPVTRTYGDPSKRPEINSSTIEFIAPAEYTLRPPPPAMYLYLLDVSHNAIDTGYLSSFCETLLENIDKIPGDTRTQIGFITYSSSIHFYSISDSYSQAKMMVYPDIEDIVLPLPDQLMSNLSENKESIKTFLQQLPDMFATSYETDSALGTALNAAYQLLKPTGGRITVMQTCLPNVGAGALKVREESIDKDSSNLAPQTDFYKKLALDCAGVHIAIDIFMFNTLYSDMATLSCAPKYSGGELKYYPGFHFERHPEQVIRFCVDLKRYLTRKIGLEAVMRIRCSRGLTIHTFHGNFFVRSTDLLALPNVNPDAGFGMQVAIEESLSDTPTISFQAAILYTSSKGERRIRIHTYCLPVSKSASDLMNGADEEAIIGLVAKMAADRTSMNSLKEAKDAMFNVGVDFLQAHGQILTSSNKTALMAPYSLRLLPLHLLALMKNAAFKFGSNVRMDDRVYAMNVMKTMPLKYLMLTIYPNLYSIHNLDEKKVVVESDAEICIPPKLHLSSENIDRHGVYVMDCGEAIYMWIGRSVSDDFLKQVFDVKSFQDLPDNSNDLPELENVMSERVRNFLVYLYDSRAFGPTFMYFREDSKKARLFFQHMYDDKSESTLSYYEFLRSLGEQVNS